MESAALAALVPEKSPAKRPIETSFSAQGSWCTSIYELGTFKQTTASSFFLKVSSVCENLGQNSESWAVIGAIGAIGLWLNRNGRQVPRPKHKNHITRRGTVGPPHLAPIGTPKFMPMGGTPMGAKPPGGLSKKKPGTDTHTRAWSAWSPRMPLERVGISPSFHDLS